MHPPRPGKVARGVLFVAFLLAGCASVPYQEMSDARQAIDAASPIVADQPGERDQVEQARDLLERAEEHLRDGDYAVARTLAEQARDLAIEARESAERAGE